MDQSSFELQHPTCKPELSSVGLAATNTERRKLAELKNRYTGTDIWLIAAGASMDFIDPGFFDGKITVGVNAVHRRFRCDYLVLRTTTLTEEALRSGSSLIVSEHEMARLNGELTRVSGPAWYFPHRQRSLHTPLDLSVIGTDLIVVGASIIVSALHIAAYLGARNILLCGHDCGSLDGKIAFDGYYDQVGNVISKWRLLNRMEEQTVAVREKLREVYGCRIYSLNPFVNFGLEQHQFRREP
jgi:hypothetical protein